MDGRRADRGYDSCVDPRKFARISTDDILLYQKVGCWCVASLESPISFAVGRSWEFIRRTNISPNVRARSGQPMRSSRLRASKFVRSRSSKPMLWLAWNQTRVGTGTALGGAQEGS